MNIIRVFLAWLMGRRFISVVEKPTVKLRRAADDLQELFLKIKLHRPCRQILCSRVGFPPRSLPASGRHRVLQPPG